MTPLPLVRSFTSQNPFRASNCSHSSPHRNSKMNVTTSGINGTITEWNGTKGTLQSEDAATKDKKFWFDTSNLVVPRYSAAYEPKLGDYVTSTAIAADETRVGRVMQSIRMLVMSTMWSDSYLTVRRIALTSKRSRRLARSELM